MDEKINIIVPVYNTEKYIECCLNSLINQTYRNIRIILVDDGSSDKSKDICDEYALKDNRIFVIHQPNFGQAAARNKGIDKCRAGEYILLVDSDDWIDLDMCEKLYGAMKKYDADIACAKGCFEYPNHTVKLMEKIIEKELKDKREFCLNFLNRSNSFCFGTVGKLYKSSIFDTIRYPEGVYYEDIYIGMDCLLEANKIVVGVDSFYHYRQNPNSTIRKFKDKLYYDALKAAMHNLNTIKVFYPDLIDLAKMHIFLTKFYTLDLLLLSQNKNEKLKNFLIRNLKNNFIYFLNNKKILMKEKMAFIIMVVSNDLYKFFRKIQRQIQHKEL